jgi:hypothetical protein
MTQRAGEGPALPGIATEPGTRLNLDRQSGAGSNEKKSHVGPESSLSSRLTSCGATDEGAGAELWVTDLSLRPRR